MDLIRRQGIGGNFLSEDHTVLHMRKAVWYPTLMDRTLSAGLSKDRERDMLVQACARRKKIMASADYEIDRDRRRAIEEIVRSAERMLTA